MPSNRKSNDILDIEYQVVYTTSLSLNSIHRRDQGQAIGFWDLPSRTDDRPDGRKLVEALCVAHLVPGSVGTLPVTGRNVVADGIAENIVEGIFVFGEILACLSNHYAKFAL